MPRKKPSSGKLSRRVFTSEFKEEAVQKLLDGHSASSIVERETSKARLHTKEGAPSIAEFAAYHDNAGDALNVERGNPAPNRIGK